MVQVGWLKTEFLGLRKKIKKLLNITTLLPIFVSNKN
jgi:hypothetical protein